MFRSLLSSSSSVPKRIAQISSASCGFRQKLAFMQMGVAELREFSCRNAVLSTQLDQHGDNKPIRPDYFDNLRYYRIMLPESFKEENRGRFIVINECKVVGLYNTLWKARDVAEPLREAYATKIGAERTFDNLDVPYSDILPLSDAEMAQILHIQALNHPEGFNLKYHPQEHQVIPADQFKPFKCKIGGGYLIVCLPLQSLEMRKKNLVCPTTCIVDTGAPNSYAHEIIRTRLNVPLDNTYTHFKVYIHGVDYEFTFRQLEYLEDGKVKEQRLEGINLIGTDFIEKLGMSIASTINETNTILAFD